MSLFDRLRVRKGLDGCTGESGEHGPPSYVMQPRKALGAADPRDHKVETLLLAHLAELLHILTPYPDPHPAFPQL